MNAGERARNVVFEFAVSALDAPSEDGVPHPSTPGSAEPRAGLRLDEAALHAWMAPHAHTER